MGSTVSAVKRVQFRLRAEDKGLLQLAASYEGESLSAFIRKAALEAACSVIERNERFVLGRAQRKVRSRQRRCQGDHRLFGATFGSERSALQS